MSKATAIIVAAGGGTRVGGDVPKQFRALLGQTVLVWSLKVLNSHPEIGQTVLVLPADRDVSGLDLDTLCDKIVSGGETRSQSVLAGLNALDCPPNTAVFIHDAARPGLTHQMIDHLLAALEHADAVAPALPVTDALKSTQGKTLISLDRSHLQRVQTPQVFRYNDIQAALASGGRGFVDDLEAIEALGKTVTLVPGTAALHKITYEEDFKLMEALLRPATPAAPRIGTGYDVHAFGPGDHVTLCGVKIPHSHGLIGHSDADIGWHALTDAILGAMALGDIGDHFPPSDPKWKGADSGQFLVYAQKLAKTAGYAISNLDITLICEAPKIKPHRAAMRARTADLLGLSLDAVSVKATTTETLGFTGREEGMAGQAVAVLTPLIKPA